MKCNYGVNAGKFLYKALANNGGPVWASDIDNARMFTIPEELELFAFEKNINQYEVVTLVTHGKKIKSKDAV